MDRRIPDTDELLDFLRLDKTKIDLEKVQIVFNETGIAMVELTYYEPASRSIKKCVIGVNGMKINEFAAR